MKELLLGFFLLGGTIMLQAQNIDTLHKEVLYSQVRVKTGGVGGSGTIIYSAEGENGEYNTYILTCHHVIESAIKVKVEWDSKLGRDIKKEYRQLVTVEFFDFENKLHGQVPVTYSTMGEIVSYDKPHDMALLKLRTVKRASYVATLLPSDMIKSIRIGSPTVAVGAALLHDPIITSGIVSHMGDEIDYKIYWMSTAQIIFGNSGGAMFYPSDGKYYFIGVPSRIDISGFNDAITHLGYFSPIGRVYEFFDEQLHHFLIPGHDHSEADCLKELKGRKDQEKKRLYMSETVSPRNEGYV